MRISLLRSIITTVCLCVAVLHADAQQKWKRYRAPEFAERPGWSLGFNFGLSDLWGDVGTKSPLDHYVNENYWDRPHFMGGVFSRYALHPGFVLRLGVNYGSVYASDNFNLTAAKSATTESDAYQRYLRNLDVKSNIWEGNILFEINPRRLGNLERKGAKKRMQPYLLIGGGGFHFKPKGTYTPRGTDGRPNGQSRMVDLYDLHLEGDGTIITRDSIARALSFTRPAKYKLWQAQVPLGLGLRWDIADQLSIGIEYMYRYTFTDYLDNVSGFYVDPRVFDIEHAKEPENAQLARDMHDKSWQIDQNVSHAPLELRGNSGVPDGYSTIAISFYYRVKSKKVPWWYQP